MQIRWLINNGSIRINRDQCRSIADQYGSIGPLHFSIDPYWSATDPLLIHYWSCSSNQCYLSSICVLVTWLCLLWQVQTPWSLCDCTVKALVTLWQVYLPQLSNDRFRLIGSLKINSGSIWINQTFTFSYWSLLNCYWSVMISIDPYWSVLIGHLICIDRLIHIGPLGAIDSIDPIDLPSPV